MTEAVIIQKPVWFLYDVGLRHERVKATLILSNVGKINFKKRF